MKNKKQCTQIDQFTSMLAGFQGAPCAVLSPGANRRLISYGFLLPVCPPPGGLELSATPMIDNAITRERPRGGQLETI